jgi:hypothetical protein
MIPDYTPPEGWRVVRYGDLPTGHPFMHPEDVETHPKLGTLSPDRLVLVRVDPPFDFDTWTRNHALAGVEGAYLAFWSDIEPVAEHVQVRNPYTGTWDWNVPDGFPDTPADAVFEVREKT